VQLSGLRTAIAGAGTGPLPRQLQPAALRFGAGFNSPRAFAGASTSMPQRVRVQHLLSSAQYVADVSTWLRAAPATTSSAAVISALSLQPLVARPAGLCEVANSVGPGLPA
jgi:hypothetical protein